MDPSRAHARASATRFLRGRLSPTTRANLPAGAGADHEKAIRYSLLAGQAATDVFAYEESAGHLQGALVKIAGPMSSHGKVTLHKEKLNGKTAIGNCEEVGA